MTQTQTLPHWDMSVVYPSLTSTEFIQGYTRLTQSITELSELFDTYKIQEHPALTLDEKLVQIFERVLTRFNAVLDEEKTLTTYVLCFITTNSQDDVAQARLSELQQWQVKLATLSTRFTAWIGSLDVEYLIKHSQAAQEHAYILLHAKTQATHLMSPQEEMLATELNVSNGAAWSKLHSNISSQIKVPFTRDGQTQELPMSVIRNLASDPDRDIRRRAYEAELAGWKQVAVPLAAAMNSIKGEVNTLMERRRWDSALDSALFNNSIDQQTLAAMLSAAREAYPDLRRYLHLKARRLGLSRLAWYDLFAPLEVDEKEWDFAEARRFIVKQFGSYSERLASFADRAFQEQWIDAEPRPGKSGGAFCISLRADESRILANYKPSFDAVSTLAHELGHGYHNLNLAHRTALQQTLPMTLAETASIFCETIIRQAVLRNANKQEQIAILEASLQDACQIVVDISSRFLFEQRVFEKRKQRELSVEELNTIMLDAQRETYGDGLDQTQLHPYMWAVKGHYYSTYDSYYNYPYMFGLLFGTGLYAQYQQDPETFKRGYDDLLSSTGLADAATLAARFGIDLRSEDFWRSSLNIIRKNVDRFEELLNEK
ncbi:M3 family oligoendopeptidase [Tengunoibacter tsumagoiensis]|uniref:Oligoendopeptidase F n=1 Tax=Tengunoibacter tsumagoiensis TaxID=2014871 RepID=A0A401ZZZ7_9CHLR|nr:M3 family oligoendopeptidase [Tengunoibacter tsumagoiensis]GCE12372.1 oligoendopeptidase F [Tengunoibacter tsumagoiensis]